MCAAIRSTGWSGNTIAPVTQAHVSDLRMLFAIRLARNGRCPTKMKARCAGVANGPAAGWATAFLRFRVRNAAQKRFGFGACPCNGCGFFFPGGLVVNNGERRRCHGRRRSRRRWHGCCMRLCRVYRRGHWCAGPCGRGLRRGGGNCCCCWLFGFVSRCFGFASIATDRRWSGR